MITQSFYTLTNIAVFNRFRLNNLSEVLNRCLKPLKNTTIILKSEYREYPPRELILNIPCQHFITCPNATVIQFSLCAL